MTASRFSRFCTYLLSLLIILSLVFPPQNELQAVALENKAAQEQVQRNTYFSFDDVVDLLDELEEGVFEQRCTPKPMIVT